MQLMHPQGTSSLRTTTLVAPESIQAASLTVSLTITQMWLAGFPAHSSLSQC